MKQYNEVGDKGKFKSRFVWRLAAIVVVFVMISGGSAWYLAGNHSTTAAQEGKTMEWILETPDNPPQPLGLLLTSFLDSEAGIAAYTNVGEPINLTKAKLAFRTIETETSEYIIGSVPLTGYSENEDVHCYVNGTDGWIVSYYMKDDPVAKILDWVGFAQGGNINNTKLDMAIIAVCNDADVTPGQIKYYDFEFPNANKLMVVVKQGDVLGDNIFYLTIPNSFTYYERSYSLYGTHTVYAARLLIDSNEIASVLQATVYGLLTPAQLTTNVRHEINVVTRESFYGNNLGSNGAIVLVYDEP